MTKQTEALKMAIDDLELCNGAETVEGIIIYTHESIQACKEALEQEQSFAEKTAQMSFMSLWDAYTTLKMKLEALEQPASKNIRESFNEMLEDKVAYYKGKQSAQKPVALIRHENGNFSPAPSWQGLSDDEIRMLEDIHKVQGTVCGVGVKTFARAIEQALKEKNHASY